MPRALNNAGDEAAPVCGQCKKSGRYCARLRKSSRFLAYSYQPGTGNLSKEAAEKKKFPPPENPRDALQSPDVAWYFLNYIAEPAKWYDLGDASRLFATRVPELALDEPLLFSAIIALSAEHVSQTTKSKPAKAVAEFYHGQCVHRLILLDEKIELLRNGVALAAVCLLRSYEILNEDIDPNRHLQGAYSLASCEDSIAASPPGSLLAAGFWNYLREDITFSLFESCPLKMDVTMASAPSLTGNQDQLHSITLILGQVINKAFSYQVSEPDWERLLSMVKTWLKNVPSNIKPFSRSQRVAVSAVGELPHFWFLQDFHASARQYALLALNILTAFAPLNQLPMLPEICDGSDKIIGDVKKEDLLEAFALEICGIAFTANIPSVLVNSFGPIAYCGKFIRSEATRQEVIRRLSACKRSVGWPVERLISSLKDSWAAEFESPSFSGEADTGSGS
ncbi:hypothetical protein TRIATDRAFT_316693 [Trichoderma atroviride IMI 206040]|uniref:Zn(2)-C6 fungal-type domain-containing protein n=1 Tax=Hypocrea atroviridis (strain ATCC 20476 / IMI 206040) TaxID=452589 RepID=G9NNL7_HYPAI|nr:uncharacterized protein TRIATDRAFT_316693 [Trichoderma atroviride IMI 206040]EHK47661.1 hypothetical protein TRIATDRAFT_316693 [Trichoderma atroviride IMI 206040]